MWWILYTYLALVATSGRLFFFFFTVKLPKVVGAVRDNIKAGGYTPSVIKCKELTKPGLIFFALLIGPFVLPVVSILPALYLLYLAVDIALYVLILSPFGWKFWKPGYIWNRKSKKLENGKFLPWYYAMFSKFDGEDKTHMCDYSSVNRSTFATVPEGRNYKEYLDKLMTGILSEFPHADVWGHQGGFIIRSNEWRIVMTTSRDRLLVAFDTESRRALDELIDSFRLTVKKVKSGL